MASNQAFKNAGLKKESGVALFMVIAAMAVLSLLVSEFTYVAQVNHKVAVEGLDQLKAHYLAKSGFKLSLLRLKAYKNVKGFLGDSKNNPGISAIASAIPKQLIDQIWSFPIVYPFPTNLPGLSPGDRDRIQKFLDESGLDGQFSALIQSESYRFNLNGLLAAYSVKKPDPQPTQTPSPAPTATPSPAATTTPFSPEEARKSLSEFLAGLFNKKLESDESFAYEYRDFNFEDLVDQMIAWVDGSYEQRYPVSDHPIKMKKGPLYSLSELHMLPLMDDRLFNLFTPSLTASPTPGINVNTIDQATLRAIFPNLTDEEVNEFFKYRDDPEKDNHFKKPDDFYSYILKNMSTLRGDEKELDRLKQDLEKRGIRFITDESEFKITITAQANKARKVLEAWVRLEDKVTTGGNTQPSSSGQPSPSGVIGPGRADVEADSGIKVHFLRFL